MAAIPGSVPVTGFVAPTDSADTYPAIDPVWGIDGLRSVANIAAMNAIPAGRRREGMVAYAQDTNLYWTLLAGPWTFTIADWVLFNGGSSSQQTMALAIGTNVLQSFPLASTEDVEISWCLTKGTVRYSSVIRCNHDGVTPDWAEGNIAVGAGVTDAAASFDILAGNLRLLGVASSGGWTARWRAQQLTT